MNKKLLTIALLASLLTSQVSAVSFATVKDSVKDLTTNVVASVKNFVGVSSKNVSRKDQALAFLSNHKGKLAAAALVASLLYANKAKVKNSLNSLTNRFNKKQSSAK